MFTDCIIYKNMNKFIPNKWGRVINTTLISNFTNKLTGR